MKKERDMIDCFVDMVCLVVLAGVPTVVLWVIRNV